MDYFRKIIYLKEYENGSPGASIGFVKLSKKQTRWKVQIHLSGGQVMQGEKIYLLDKDKNAVNKLLYGTITERGNEIEMERSSGEMGMLKGKLAGILIGGEGYVVCAGIEDETVRISDFVREKKHAAEAVAAEETEKETDGKEADLKRPRQEEEPQEEPREVEQEEPSGDAIPEEEEEEEEIIQVELMEEHDQNDVFRRLFDTRTNMYPFEDDEMDECVQISPADFSDFPKEYWQMGSNTFLLQGYYNYRHLILARAGEKVYVGIPGQYHRRDKYLADMFGFNRFKGIQKRQERLGDFGYWMKEIELPRTSGCTVCIQEDESGCLVCAPEETGKSSLQSGVSGN